MKKILFIVLVLSIIYTGCSGRAIEWGVSSGYEQDIRVSALPFPVWKRDVPTFSDTWGIHHDLACWMLPGERYRVYDMSSDGLYFVDSGRCAGSAKVVASRE